jgi:flavin reductase (DIM6/NTAB) family NADH-FMN oxidoreductase RutF
LSDAGDHNLSYRYEDPFAAPQADRRSDRRLRGRLVAPVTVWTAGGAEHRVGLTVSSVLVIEGEPPHLLGALDPLSELRDVLEEQGRFVVHVLGDGDRKLAAAFAGTYPLRPFEGVEVEDTEHGPRIAGDRTIARCRYETAERVGYLDLVRASVEHVELAGDPSRPSAFYRGRFGRLEPQERPRPG